MTKQDTSVVKTNTACLAEQLSYYLIHMAQAGEIIHSSSSSAWELHLGTSASGHLLQAPSGWQWRRGQGTGRKSPSALCPLLRQGRPQAEHSWGMQQAGYHQPDPSWNSSGEQDSSVRKHRFSWCNSWKAQGKRWRRRLFLIGWPDTWDNGIWCSLGCDHPYSQQGESLCATTLIVD